MSEETLQIEVAEYLNQNYPDVQFHSDFGTGTRLKPYQAKKQKAMNAGRKGWPDMIIARRKRVGERTYAGLFIELKREGTRLKKRNGEWSSSYIAEQAEQICKLQNEGYAAHFAVGFEQAKQIIDDYLSH